MMIPAAVSAMMLACAGSAPEVAVTVSNPAEGTFESQTVELPAAEILERLGTRGFEVRDAAGEVVPSQLTHDSLIIFRATVGAGAQAVYHIAGLDTMPHYPAVACGRIYPERADDVAWENELVGFRVRRPRVSEPTATIYFSSTATASRYWSSCTVPRHRPRCGRA